MKQKLSPTLDNYKHYSHFETTFLNVLNDHAPLKKKIFRANEVPYMTKSLRKAIATRLRLENVYYRKKTTESKIAYSKEKNYCSRLYKKRERSTIFI